MSFSSVHGSKTTPGDFTMTRIKILIAALLSHRPGRVPSRGSRLRMRPSTAVKGYVYPSFAWPGSSVSVYSEAFRPGEEACINSALFNFDTVVGGDDGSSSTDLPWFAWTGPLELNIFSKPCRELRWGDMPDDRISR